MEYRKARVSLRNQSSRTCVWTLGAKAEIAPAGEIRVNQGFNSAGDKAAGKSGRLLPPGSSARASKARLWRELPGPLSLGLERASNLEPSLPGLTCGPGLRGQRPGAEAAGRRGPASPAPSPVLQGSLGVGRHGFHASLCSLILATLASHFPRGASGKWGRGACSRAWKHEDRV